MKIASVSKMQNMDREAIQKYQIPEEILMENAGIAVFHTLVEKYTIRTITFYLLREWQ